MVQLPAKPTPESTLTLEMFLQQPETKPASEYIDGKIIQKPMPQARHSTLQGELVSSLNVGLKRTRIAAAFRSDLF